MARKSIWLTVVVGGVTILTLNFFKFFWVTLRDDPQATGHWTDRVVDVLPLVAVAALAGVIIAWSRTPK